MPEVTLENLAARVEVLEQRLNVQQAPPLARTKDWRRTVGMFAGSEFIKQLDAECAAMREAERVAARGESSE